MDSWLPADQPHSCFDEETLREMLELPHCGVDHVSKECAMFKKMDKTKFVAVESEATHIYLGPGRSGVVLWSWKEN